LSDTGLINLFNQVGTYNNINTAGTGLVPVRASAAHIAQSATISSEALLTAPAPGSYIVKGNLATAIAGTGNVTLTLNYTDGPGAKTIVVPLPVAAGTTGTSMLLTAGNSASFYWFVPEASGNLTYTVTYAGTGTYNIYITATQEQ